MTETTMHAAPSKRLRIALIALAAIEAAGALTNLSTIFNDYGHTTALLKFAQALGTLNLALAPIFALAALYFAAAGKLTYAIIAIAIRILVTWATDLPSIAIHGLELSADLGGLTILGYRFALPVMAAAAIWLARRNERLWLATIIVALPSVATWLSVLVFTVAVMIYGF